MKTITLILLAIFSTTVVAQESWSDWQSTQCYENIEFRTRYIKKYGKRHQWEVQFKNNYDRLVVFNYGVSEDAQELALTTNRKTLDGGQTSKPIALYTQVENFFILVDMLSFYTDSRNFEPCNP